MTTIAHASLVLQGRTAKKKLSDAGLAFKCMTVSAPTYYRLCLNHTVQKDSRGVLGTSFKFGPTSEILENIQYGGSSVVKTDSQRSRFIAREA